jgi:hypothetical protein
LIVAFRSAKRTPLTAEPFAERKATFARNVFTLLPGRWSTTLNPLDTPLFVKTHDWTLWLLERTQRFPKQIRHSYTNRLESLAFDFEELLLLANASRGTQRREYLERADARLICLKALLRYAGDLRLLAINQLRYAAEQLDQLGRLLGAWLKGTDR